MFKLDAACENAQWLRTDDPLFAYAALIGPASVGVQSLPLQAVTSEVTIVAQVQIQRSSIVRVPPAAPPSRLAQVVKWKEKGAPNCIKWSSMAAAMVSSPTTIDLVVRGGTRYRVKLEKAVRRSISIRAFTLRQRKTAGSAKIAIRSTAAPAANA